MTLISLMVGRSQSNGIYIVVKQVPGKRFVPRLSETWKRPEIYSERPELLLSCYPVTVEQVSVLAWDANFMTFP